jgi:multimeric flavodoxin WrbA
MKNKILGIASSLRNARWGSGNKQLIDSLKSIQNENELFEFLSVESELHLENFVKAGRGEGKSFDELYKNLKKNIGDKGLSNSETALSAALWEAQISGCDIDHISLSEFFLSSGRFQNKDILINKIMESDGILVSGPVYFGDRSSLLQKLIDFILNDESLRKSLENKVYAGISVGAKRNGGQETSLVYNLYDFVRFGALGVGNSSDTTSQYGGTCVAGDIGMAHKDQYGIKTSMGTGKRLAEVVKIYNSDFILNSKLDILFLVLQDKDGLALNICNEIISSFPNESFKVINVCEEHVLPCIGCDICPTNIDVDEVYRCIVTNKNDCFDELHNKLFDYDAIIPVVYSPTNRTNIKTSYQTFLERTRYIRRGDYLWSNTVVMPFVIEDIGGQDNYAMRCLTAFIRHHTIVSAPIVAFNYNNHLIDFKNILDSFNKLIIQTRKITAGKIVAMQSDSISYSPVGYILSADKEAEDTKLHLRSETIVKRKERLDQRSIDRNIVER